MTHEMQTGRQWQEVGPGGESKGGSNGLDAGWGGLNDPKHYWAVISTLELILLFQRMIKHLNYCFNHAAPSKQHEVAPTCEQTYNSCHCCLYSLRNP